MASPCAFPCRCASTLFRRRRFRSTPAASTTSTLITRTARSGVSACRRRAPGFPSPLFCSVIFRKAPRIKCLRRKYHETTGVGAPPKIPAIFNHDKYAQTRPDQPLPASCNDNRSGVYRATPQWTSAAPAQRYRAGHGVRRRHAGTARFQQIGFQREVPLCGAVGVVDEHEARIVL